MIRYAVVYSLLAVLMVALVFIIGMPWTEKRRRFAWNRARRDRWFRS